MIPKIKFVYSKRYDQICKDAFKKTEITRRYPSPKKVHNHMKKYEKAWDKHKKKILTSISNVNGLKWKEMLIKCYVVGNTIPYSNPLTVPAYNDENKFIDVLTHELIHQIEFQNYERYSKWHKYLKRKYPQESIITIFHISVHAVHKYIFLDILKDPKRLEREYGSIKKNFPKKYKKYYLNSWRIVEEEGYENIIKKFKKLTKP